VIQYPTESRLLLGWKEHVVESDPDVITGYNIGNFDLPYVLGRAEALELDDFPFLGRMRESRTTMKVRGVGTPPL
jgi:DNA polymerase delta subunit 1